MSWWWNAMLLQLPRPRELDNTPLREGSFHLRILLRRLRPADLPMLQSPVQWINLANLWPLIRCGCLLLEWVTATPKNLQAKPHLHPLPLSSILSPEDRRVASAGLIFPAATARARARWALGIISPASSLDSPTQSQLYFSRAPLIWTSWTSDCHGCVWLCVLEGFVFGSLRNRVSTKWFL